MKDKSFYNLLKLDKEKENIDFRKEIIHFKIIDLLNEVKGEMNRSDLADLLNFSKAYITKLYNGEKYMNLEFLAKIEKIFNVEFEFAVRSNKSSYEVVTKTITESISRNTEVTTTTESNTDCKIININESDSWANSEDIFSEKM